jgi:hypothetical protein
MELKRKIIDFEKKDSEQENKMMWLERKILELENRISVFEKENKIKEEGSVVFILLYYIFLVNC